jgi:hypothetical protein
VGASPSDGKREKEKMMKRGFSSLTGYAGGMNVPAFRSVATVSLLCASIALCWCFAVDARAATPPVILERSAISVTDTGAVLQAQIDPEGSPVAYRFEYGSSEAYGSRAPAADGSVGSGTSAVTVTAHPQGLTPGTTYHYRVVAVVAERDETVLSTDGTFTTEPGESRMTLPDGRQWELVSPPNKSSGSLSNRSEGLIQAAEDGSAISYIATGPTEQAPMGNRAPVYVQVFSKRGPAGWETRDITAPNQESGHVSSVGSEYKYFSPDLSLGLLTDETSSLFSPEATERTPYLYEMAAGRFVPLVTSANVSPGTAFGGSPEALRGPVNVESASPDLEHIVVTSSVALTSAEQSGEEGLYEWSEGHLEPISISPENGELESGKVGYDAHDTRRAVSDDGTRVVWGTAEGNLYLRDTQKQETIQLNVSQGGSGENGRAQFQIANSDASRIFFTDSSALVNGAAESPPGLENLSLYECRVVEAAGKLKCDLTDLTPEAHSGEQVEVDRQVIGASEDGSYIYFLAGGALTADAGNHRCSSNLGETPPDETCNLYVSHDGVLKLIAAPPVSDFDTGNIDSDGSVYLMSAQVSPNGRFLAFMSSLSLTGYDNRDAVSGVPDEEVYLYDAQSERLSCVSCNPTGARPHGVLDLAPGSDEERQLIMDGSGIWEGKWLSATLTPWIDNGIDFGSTYVPRGVADDGRVFFNSSDALVPQDTNGLSDVYEYESAGVGSCTSADPGFSDAAGGCVDLISSGVSSEESAFLDASASGDDAFFLTAGQLVSADRDGALDLYDAHVCSSAAPCLSSVAVPPPCSTVDSCRVAPAVQPSIFGAPGSATFAGAGNPVAPTVKPVAKAKKKPTKAKKKPKHKQKAKKKVKRKRAKSRRERTAHTKTKAGVSAATRR